MDPTLAKDIDTVLSLVRGHNWIAIAAILDGLLIRLSKDDRYVRFFPVAIAPKWRPWFALAVGVVEGCVAIKLLSHGAWSEAIFGGFSAGVTAITGHELVVESLRGGRDLFVPKAPPPPPGSTPPPAPKPISIKPPANVTIITDSSAKLVALFAAAVVLLSCQVPEPVVLLLRSDSCDQKARAAKGDAGTCDEKRARMEAVLHTDPACVDLYGDATPELVCHAKPDALAEGGTDGDR